jgi:hypothetical protein
MNSLGRQPAGGSDLWPTAVCNPRYEKRSPEGLLCEISDGCGYGSSRNAMISA